MRMKNTDKTETLKGRAKMRGSKLHRSCYRADVLTHEYGMDDDRCFCGGLVNPYIDTVRIIPKCEMCGAYIGNAKPMDGK